MIFINFVGRTRKSSNGLECHRGWGLSNSNTFVGVDAGTATTPDGTSRFYYYLRL